MTRPLQNALAPQQGVLGDARFLAALGVLLVNDLYLKVTHPGFVAGKLSDLAGFIVFPVLMWALVGIVGSGVSRFNIGRSFVQQSRRLPWSAEVLIVAFVVGWFVGLQTSVTIDAAHETIVGWLLPWTPVNTPDMTDLVALPAALIGWQVLDDARRTNSWKVQLGPKSRTVVLGVGLLACVADQPAPEPEFGAIVEGADGSLELRLTDADWEVARLVSSDNGQTWERTRINRPLDEPAPLGEVSPQGCLNAEPSRCFLVEQDEGTDVRIIEISGDESTEVWRHIDENYARESWASPFGAGEVKVLSDDTVIVTTRGGPIVRRDSSGTWSPDPLSLRRGEALGLVIVVGLVIVATFIALMMRGHRLLKVGLVVAAFLFSALLPANQHVDLGIVGVAWLAGLAVTGTLWMVLMAVVLIRGIKAERRSQQEPSTGPSATTRVLLGLIPLLIVGPAIPWLADVDVRLSTVWYANWMLLVVGGLVVIVFAPTESKLGQLTTPGSVPNGPPGGQV